MWSKVIVFAYFVLTIVCQPSASVLLKAGQCPRIKAKANFDINKFMGQWFVTYRDRSEADCIRQNITSNGLNKYFLTEIREPLAKGVFTTKKYEIQTNSNLKSELFLGTGYGPKQALLVLMTDYNNYAVTYSCHRSTFGHKQDLSVLSRTKTLSDLYLNKIYRYIYRLGLTRGQLQNINQEECEEPELTQNGFAINKPWYYFFTKYSPTEEVDPLDDKYW